MSQLVDAIAQCLATGAVFTSLCAALIVPPFAWLGVQVVTPAIARMTDDHRWQAALAAASALLPGTLFAVLIVVGIFESANSPCLELTAGKVLFGLLALLIAGSIVRAVMRSWDRNRDLHAKLGNATPAMGRNARIAAEVGVPLFLVNDDRELIVVVSATPRAGVYISTAALAEFDDAELRAALYHERAHIDRADHRIAPCLYFVADLLPLPVDRLIDIYRCSREFCADRCALERVGRTDLAAALLRVARGPAPIATAAFAERDVMYARLDDLLRPTAAPKPDLRRRYLAAIMIASIFIAGLAVPMIGPFFLHCNLLRLVS